MPARMIEDGSGRKLQLFAPSRAQAVTADTAWTPGEHDVAFCVTEDISYDINDVGTDMPLAKGSIRGIVSDCTYTFNATSVLEVM